MQRCTFSSVTARSWTNARQCQEANLVARGGRQTAKTAEGSSLRTNNLEELRTRKSMRGKTPILLRSRNSKTKSQTTKRVHELRTVSILMMCPAKDATCNWCNKKGHYHTQCFTKQVSAVPNDGLPDPTFWDILTGKHASAWFCTVELNKSETSFKFDIGADVTVISDETYAFLQKPQLNIPDKTLYDSSRQPLKTLGQLRRMFCHKGATVQQPVYVVGGLKINLLGFPAITAQGLACWLDAIGTIVAATTVPTYIKQHFPSLHQRLGNLGNDYEIHLKSGAVVYSLLAPRHIPLPLCPKVKKELDRMESIGVISKVNEPTPWYAGMMEVGKKDETIRICVDMKPLHQNVLHEVHPLPKVHDTLA